MLQIKINNNNNNTTTTTNNNDKIGNCHEGGIQIEYPHEGNVNCHFRSNFDYLDDPHY